MKDQTNVEEYLAAVTAAAAAAAAPYAGTAQKEEADLAAVIAMRDSLNRLPITATVIIGEGEKDEAPMLAAGEELGSGGIRLDLAVDPVEGTDLLAEGRSGSLAILAAAPEHAMFDPGPAFYMDKLIVGPAAVGKVDLDAPMEETVVAIARAEGIPASEVTVAILDRPRNAHRIAGIRKAGAEPMLLDHGDVGPSLMAGIPNSGVHATTGIGGTPEGVAIACAMRGLGGEMQGRLAPQLPAEKLLVLDFFSDPDSLLTDSDLVANGPAWFAATGITGGGAFSAVVGDGKLWRTRTLAIGMEHEWSWIEESTPLFV